MILDSSAVIAILTGERETDGFLDAMSTASSLRMSVVSFVETSIVIDTRYGVEGLRDLDRLIAQARVQLLAVTLEQGKIAREAFRRFGKGRHRARLNFGDCFAYAAAIAESEPLLCKGTDFIYTDVTVFKLESPWAN